MPRGQKPHWQLLQRIPATPPARPISIDPGIRYAPSGMFYVYGYRDGRDFYIDKFADIKDAVRARDRFRGSEAEPVVSKRDGKITADAFCEETFAPIATAEMKPSTERSFRSRYKTHVKPVLGELRLSDITWPLLARFRATLLKSSLSRQTQREVLSIVKNLFAEAKRHNLIAVDPAAGLELPEKRASRITVPPDATVRAIIEGIAHPVARMAAEVLYATGMRVNECLALTWEDIDLPAGKIHVTKSVDQVTGTIGTPKTKNAIRTIDAPMQLVEKLTRYRNAQLAGDADRIDPWVFPASRRVSDGTHLPVLNDRNFAQRYWEPARTAVTDRRVTFHTLRHLYASKLLKQGASLPHLAAVLGHASAAFTMQQYVHLVDDPADMRSVIERAFG